MKLSVSEQIICELHTMGAINEQTGLNGKEVTELVNNAKAPSRLAELRKAGYVKSSDRSTGAMRFWLTPAGETYAIELKHYASESKHDQANNASENNVLSDVGDTNVADSQANSENVYQDENSDQLDEKLDIPPPQYNPDDVAFKKSDTVFWYTVDGIKEVFETSSDAIHAAQELVKNRKIVATIHAVASKPHAIIKPVVTTELEYL